MALDDALSALAEVDARKSQVVEMRFFGGLSVEETAEALHVSVDTVMRDWKPADVVDLCSFGVGDLRGDSPSLAIVVHWAAARAVALAGSAIGMLGALGVSRLIAAGWPGMTMSALSVLPLAALALIALGLLASYIPARSASRMSPLEALRAE
jgi:hypothetical protein